MGTASSRAPAPSRLGRWHRYLAAMFPPLVMGPTSFLRVLAIAGCLQVLARPGLPVRLSWRLVGAAVAFFLLLLLFRVLDELKDEATDQRLARAGDPRYSGRPSVTGEIARADLVALRATIVGALLVLHLAMGSAPVFMALVGVLGVAWLSSRWFFWPRVRESLVLALVTHNPITLLLQLYVMVVVLVEVGGARLPVAEVVALHLGLWAPVAAWETSRKIRVPEDETAYQTYSQVLGWKLAPLLPASLILGGTLCLSWLALRCGLPVLFVACLVGAALVPLAALLRFRLRPSTASARLQPFAEVYLVATDLGWVVALALHVGVDLTRIGGVL